MPKYISTPEDAGRFFVIDPMFNPGASMESSVSYREAKEFAQGFRLSNVLDWFKIFDENSKSIPCGIPRRPHAIYKDFEGYEIFLGLNMNNKKSAIEIAEDFLIRTIGSEAISVNKIFEIAKEQGIQERTIRRAKKNLTIKATKRIDGWFWVFPIEHNDNA